MYCPNCGAADQNPNAYCRQCGDWLVDQKSARRHGSKPDDQMKVMLVFNGLSAIFALVSAIALYATYLDTPEAKWSVYVAGAFCSIIAVHQTVSFFFAFGLRQKFKRGRGAATRSIDPKTEGARLVTSPETAPILTPASVTENTTDLLESPGRKEGQRTLSER